MRTILPDKGKPQALEDIYHACTLLFTEYRKTLRHCNNQKHPYTSLKASWEQKRPRLREEKGVVPSERENKMCKGAKQHFFGATLGVVGRHQEEAPNMEMGQGHPVKNAQF